MLECDDGSLYTGWTTNLSARLNVHRRGLGSRFVRSRLPFRLTAYWRVADRSAALREELAFKALDKAAKLEAIRTGKVFGHTLINVPDVCVPVKKRRPARTTGGTMATHTAPTGAELDTLAKEAETAVARIKTKKGDIVFKFYPHEAKQHSAAFIKLAKAGFYDGLTFHRVIGDFMIQGGCPEGTGTGGPGYNLPAEFNNHKHVRGTVAAARSQNPNSAGSQFYICHGDTPHLDKQYTVFGQTIEGEDVVDKIRVGDVMDSITIEEPT